MSKTFALVTYTKSASKPVEEVILKLKEDLKDKPHLYLNLYAIPEISKEADAFASKAIKELDSSMKGWRPKGDNLEVGYQIVDLLEYPEEEIQYIYTRFYEK